MAHYSITLAIHEVSFQSDKDEVVKLKSSICTYRYCCQKKCNLSIMCEIMINMDDSCHVKVFTFYVQV